MARKHLARASRRCLLWLAGGFVLCQAVLATAIDGWLGHVRDPEYADKLCKLRGRLAEAPGRPLVLMLGSSRTAYGLDARRLSGPGSHDPLVFNFGQMGGGGVLQGVTLRRLLEEGIRPELVFVEMIPAQMLQWKGRLLEEKMLDGARLRAPEMLAVRHAYHEPQRVLAGWLLGRLLPCYRHQAEIRTWLGLVRPETAGLDPSDPDLVDSHGWRARTDPMTASYCYKATAMALGQYEEPCASTRIAEEAVRALESVVKVCRREGIPVAVVLMPEGSRFRALYTPQAMAACAAVLARLKDGCAVQVVDARTWVDDDGFWDTHHMLPRGAHQFADRFAREVLAPALAARPCAVPCVARPVGSFRS
jgi:hypothetical protein